MNIGIDIRSLMNPQKTGVGEYTHELLQALFLQESAHDFFLFSNSYRETPDDIPTWEHERVHAVSKRIPNKILNGSMSFFRRPRLDRLIVKQYNDKTMERLDMFFSPNIHFTSISPKTKHILTVHDLSFEHFPECYSWKRRLWHRIINPKKQCERADMILVPSEHTKKDMIQTYGISDKKITVLSPGLSSLFSEQYESNTEVVKKTYRLPEKYILFLGTIEPRKNIGALVEAFATSGLKKKGYTLVIAGAMGWKAKPIMQKILLANGVRYIGYVSAEDKPELYRLADVFVYPSLYEGFGFPVLEAMSVGTPVITSNRSSLPEVVGSAACLVNPLNVAEIADAMVRTLSNPRLAEYYADRGRRQAQRFGWGESAKKLLAQFEL